jgi:hypothetical protein
MKDVASDGKATEVVCWNFFSSDRRQYGCQNHDEEDDEWNEG